MSAASAMTETALAAPRLLPSGDSAVTVEFARSIDADANARVLALDRLIARARVAGLRETVPTYRSLLVHYDPAETDFSTICAELLALAAQARPAVGVTRRWRVPVIYGGEHGIDLENAAATLKLTPDELVARHSGGDYRVAMIGFTPGWSYLSGLDPALQLPRRTDPRILTPAGTISIGGIQAGIQCLAGPSGWHLLGRTPVRTFQLGRNPMFLLEPGDAVSFYSIDGATFDDMERAAEAGEPVAEMIAA